MGHTTEAVERATHAKGSLEKDRFILQQLVTKDFKLRYRRSVLGVVWSVLNPLLMMMIMSFVFSYFLRGSNVENYPLYLIVGNVTFGLMNEATSTGLRSIIDAAPLLKKVKVDRWVFPVQKVLSAMVNFALSLIAVVIVMLFFRIAPTWHIVWMLPALLLLMLFCVGISLLIGAAAVFFRDMIHLWSVALTAWTYLTPIFWDLSLLTNAGARSSSCGSSGQPHVQLPRDDALRNRLPVRPHHHGDPARRVLGASRPRARLLRLPQDRAQVHPLHLGRFPWQTPPPPSTRSRSTTSR